MTIEQLEKLIRKFLRHVEKLPADDSRRMKASAVGRIRQSMRTEFTPSGGRPRVPTKCPKCGEVCEGYRIAQAHCSTAKQETL